MRACSFLANPKLLPYHAPLWAKVAGQKGRHPGHLVLFRQSSASFDILPTQTLAGLLRIR